MFAIHPKENCPHQEDIDFSSVYEKLTDVSINSPCKTCQDTTENWFCLHCEQFFCSRYVNAHMAAHNESEGHSVALSLTDASFWCYSCDSYVNSAELRRVGVKLGNLKYPNVHNIDDVDKVIFDQSIGGASSSNSSELEMNSKPSSTTAPVEFANEASAADSEEVEVDASPYKVEYDSEAEDDEEDMRPKKVFTKEQLVQGMRDKAFKNVTFMTGAGISVAAGIPDFRTPGIGLYAKAAILGLPYPEAVFCLDYLRERPSAFYNIANGFLTFKAKPVKAHHFIKRFSDEGLLQMNYTQNIDGLELEAGLSLEKLVQAHGHMRTAGCIDCGKPSDIDEFFAHVAKETVQYCLECNGIIKPDIVFFGESLPAKFAEQFHQIGRSDLVFVMGTSLKVYPFASLLTALAPGTPVVLLNRENPGINMDHLLFLPGAIEDSVAMLADEFGWGDLAMGTTDEQAGEKEASVEVTAKFSVLNI